MGSHNSLPGNGAGPEALSIGTGLGSGTVRIFQVLSVTGPTLNSKAKSYASTLS